MSNVVAVVYVSLDGVMENPAWTAPFWNDEHAAFQYEQLLASRALLMGRITYEGMSQAWPTMTDEQGFADRMNALPKYVASTTLDTVEWNATLIEGDVTEQVAELKQEPGSDLLIYGSATLINHLIKHDLIDELNLFLHPVVVGTGKRMFPDGVDTSTWQLTGTHPFSSGAIVLTYRPADTSTA